MRATALAASCLVLLSPILLLAAGPPNVPSTPRESIRFTEPTERGFDRSGQHVTTSLTPDGATAVSLNGSFQNVTVARIGPGGGIETWCTTDASVATAWMAREDGRPANVEVSDGAGGDPR